MVVLDTQGRDEGNQEKERKFKLEVLSQVENMGTLGLKKRDKMRRFHVDRHWVLQRKQWNRSFNTDLAQSRLLSTHQNQPCWWPHMCMHQCPRAPANSDSEYRHFLKSWAGILAHSQSHFHLETSQLKWGLSLRLCIPKPTMPPRQHSCLSTCE